MFRVITTLALRHTRTLAVALLLALPVLAVAGAGLPDRLSAGGFNSPGAESSQAEALLARDFATGPADYLVVATAENGLVEDEANRQAGLALIAALAADPGVEEVASFWQLPVPAEANPLRSPDGRRAIVTARLAGDESTRRLTAARLEPVLDQQTAFELQAGGPTESGRQAAEQAENDLRTAELLAVPLTLAALLWVFRGWRAAVLPLAVAILAVLTTFAALNLLTRATDVSTFALNLTTALGLGLAIDYSLLIVARFREELAADGRTPDVAAALHRTMVAAGPTVLFSAATVATSLLALLVFPVVYLRSFAYAGVVVVTAAAAAAMIVAPVLLALFGARIGTPRRARSQGFWHRQTARVTARPLPWLIGVTAILLALGLPFVRFDPTTIDERVLPAGAEARQAAEAVGAEFDDAALNPVTVIAPDVSARDRDALVTLERTFLAVPNVARVDSVLGSATAVGRAADPLGAVRFAGPGSTWMAVTLAVDPDSNEAEQAVTDLRRAAADTGHRTLIGGATATRIDAVEVVTDRVPAALGLIALTTVVLLFAMTGSVVVPIKALGLNLLSLTATFGALVWIFQDGNLGALGTTAVGRLDVFTPILMFCIAFGLSMDYEVFLLARIKEEYDRTGDSTAAVVEGIGRTGRLVTAAALLLAIVFVAISTSGISVVRMFGVGLALAVVTDAFAVRATLTPALMTLAGHANWWAPGWLRQAHLRWGLWEDSPITFPAPLAGPATGPLTDPTPLTTGKALS